MGHDRVSPSEEESVEAVDTDYLPPYMPRKEERGARVTMSSSCSLLSRYQFLHHQKRGPPRDFGLAGFNFFLRVEFGKC